MKCLTRADQNKTGSVKLFHNCGEVFELFTLCTKYRLPDDLHDAAIYFAVRFVRVVIIGFFFSMSLMFSELIVVNKLNRLVILSYQIGKGCHKLWQTDFGSGC